MKIPNDWTTEIVNAIGILTAVVIRPECNLTGTDKKCQCPDRWHIIIRRILKKGLEDLAVSFR